MKTAIKITIKILLILTILIGCKEIEFEDNFDFEFTTDFDTNGLVNEDENLILTINQEKLITTNQYYINYKLVEGNGFFKDSNENVIFENEKTKINRENTIIYTPNEAGEHQIKIIISDDYGNKKETILNYRVVDKVFEFTATTDVNEDYISQNIPINFKITENIISNYNYKMYFKFNDGFTGTFTYNGTTYQEGIANKFDVPLGTSFQGFINGNTPGLNKIKFYVVNDSNSPITLERLIIVNLLDSFNFSAISNITQDYILEDLPINFSITENVIHNYNYQMYFTFNDGFTGTFTYNGTTYQEGIANKFDVPLGTSFQGFIKGNVFGVNQIRFYVVNDSNSPITLDDLINIELLEQIMPTFTLNVSNNEDLNPTTTSGLESCPNDSPWIIKYWKYTYNIIETLQPNETIITIENELFNGSTWVTNPTNTNQAVYHFYSTINCTTINSYYSKIRFRIKDSNNNWSEWVEHTY